MSAIDDEICKTLDALNTYRDAFAELLLLQYGAGCATDKLWQQAQKYQQMRRDREALDSIPTEEPA